MAVLSRREKVCRPWRPWATALAALVLLAVAAAPGAATEYRWQLPKGFPAPRVPEDNPVTVEKVELGRFLFYDTRLSGNRTYACASCHEQAHAFTDALPLAIGSTGEVHPRNSMNLTNVAYSPTLAWANPLLHDLEDQALIPMFGETPVELGLSGREDELLGRLAGVPRYQRMFAEAFPDDDSPISLVNIVSAIASFDRTLISGNSPYDRYVFGDDDALSPSAINGGALFFSERLECFHCHGGFNFSSSVVFEGQRLDEITFENNALYNIGGDGGYPPMNQGLFEFTHKPADQGRFKPPTLRNVELTAPYMHDGSIATLDQVLDHYAAGGRTITEGPYAGVGSENPNRSIFVRGFQLSEQERADVLSFLVALTDREFVTNPRFSDPFAPVTCTGDCNYGGSVTVDELITGVNVALGDASLAACVVLDRNADAVIDVSELVTAVNFTLGGCPR